ncbi:hypothetical protein FNE52_04045 [Helicobacter pylori]|nr:hypothetical protein FNE52_04045 [Helicobacter pylori]
MLEALNALNQLNALHSKNAAHHFNATLPILLKVLEKQDKDLFLLQVGNRIIPTKSEKTQKIPSMNKLEASFKILDFIKDNAL